MKISWIKYLFFLIIAVLMGIGAYFMYLNYEERQGATGSNREEIQTERAVNIGIYGYDTINSILSISRDVQYLSKLIYRSLLRVTPEFTIENDIVEEWAKVNERLYLVRLQEGISWHNGNPLTAYDVEFTIRGIQNLSGQSIYKANVSNISEVEVLEEYLLRIHLSEPVPFFEYKLTFPILCRETYDENTLESLEDLPVGAGIYRISELGKNGVILEFTGNEEGTGYPLIINVSIFETAVELYHALSRENIDVIHTLNIDYQDIIGSIGFRNNISTGRRFTYLGINNNHPILSNREVRQAINYGVNSYSIVERVFRNKYIPSTFPLSSETFWYNPQSIIRGSIHEAREILSRNDVEERIRV